jgi:hypothetical protein
MTVNPQIKSVLQQFNIPVEDGLAYLLSIYFDCRPSYTPTLLVQRMNVTNILGIDANRQVIWHIPLFEKGDSEDKWQWVFEWNTSFKAINKLRKASDKDVLIRMKAFFADNPDVRKEEVIGATKLYFNSLTSAEYLITSHYFISKGVGRDRTSALYEWVEKYRDAMTETKSDSAFPTDLATTMQ